MPTNKAVMPKPKIRVVVSLLTIRTITTIIIIVTGITGISA
jgi:hypothetical protein